MQLATLHLLFNHPRWKWVTIFAACELVSIMSLYVSVQGGSMAWIGGATAAFFAPGMAVAVLQLAKPRPVFRVENEFVVRRSPWVLLAYLSVCCGWFCGGTIVLSHRPETSWIGWGLVYMCAFGAIVSLGRFLDRRPLMIINDNGVMDSSFGGMWIPWNEIRGANIQTVRGTEVICLDLKDPDKLLGAMRSKQRLKHVLNQAASLELLHLGMVQMDSAYIDQALDYILAKCSCDDSPMSAEGYNALLNIAQQTGEQGW